MTSTKVDQKTLPDHDFKPLNNMHLPLTTQRQQRYCVKVNFKKGI